MPVAFESPYLHFTLIACAVLLISLLFLLRRLTGAIGQMRRKRRPGLPYQPALLRYNIHAAIFWLFPLFLGILLLWFAVYLSGYQYVGARVAKAGVASFHRGSVQYASTDGRQKLVMPVRGKTVAAAGVFLRFPTWLSYAGLGSYHKVISFRGFQDNRYHYIPPDADWLQSYCDPLYLFAYRNSDRAGLLNAFYAESPYFDAGKHEIYVTRSGYIVR